MWWSRQARRGGISGQRQPGGGIVAQAVNQPGRAADWASAEALYADMALIRRFEETLLDLFAAGKLAGTTHTCIGQEADAAAVTSRLADLGYL